MPTFREELGEAVRTLAEKHGIPKRQVCLELLGHLHDAAAGWFADAPSDDEIARWKEEVRAEEKARIKSDLIEKLGLY